MTNKMTADTVAKATAAALQPATPVINAAANVTQTPLPANPPLPGPLAKSLGQSRR